MEPVRTVAVAGLGLIGGSVARDLARRGVRVLAWDRDPAAVRAALDAGVVSAALGDDLSGVESADVLLLAVPVLAAPGVLEKAIPRLGGVRLVTDAGSTKASLAAAAGRLGMGSRFVGAHPLAGSHERGWAAAREGLFDGATVYLCPTPESTEDAVALATELWASLGGRLRVMDAGEHDRLLAWTSHLPQAVSSALAAALAEQGIARSQLGSGGRDVTRLAASSTEMWADILRDNCAALADALAAVEARIRSLREALQTGDDDASVDLLSIAHTWAEGGASAEIGGSGSAAN